MTPERWRQIEEIYHLALAHDGGQRSAFLKQACDSDEEMLREIESLLAHEEPAEEFLKAPGMAVLAQAVARNRTGSMIGRRIGPYQILSLLGAGGMGEVYRAKDTRLDRTVAIKILPEHLSQKPQLRERFEREARAVSSLSHPHICPLYDVGQQDGFDFLVMEYLDGETLAQKLKKGPLPLDQALRVAVEIAGALDHAHRHGVVHRDLKPGNIILTKAGAKVLDFGLAKVPAAAGTPDATQPTNTLTEEGVILGTVQYMSPEQVQGKETDARSDIFSFGLVLYEMIAGKPAFAGTNPASIIAAILEREAPSLEPEGLNRVVRACLAKDPAERFQSARDLKRAIEWRVSGDGEMPHLGGAPELGPRWRASWSIWAAVTVLAIAAGFGLWKLSASLATPVPKVLRLAVSIPAGQGFVDIAGNAVLFAPDGSAIVYSGRGPHGSQLYYRRLDQLEGTALPGTDNACCTAISPSGDWVAFEARSAVSKVSVRGGAPIALAKVAYTGGISWGSDDSIFSAEGETGLFRIPANGGPAQRIAVPNPAKHELAWYMPMVLPDGKNVLVFVYRQPRGAKLAMVRIADGEVTELEGEGENPIGVVGGYLLFGRIDGTLGVAPFDPARTRSVEAVIPVLDAPLHRNSGVEAALSSAGDLVYVKATGDSRITFLDAQGHITGGSRDERNFSWDGLRMSPDGRQFVVRELIENRGRGDLWLYDVASGVRQRLTTGVDASAPEWTPDGHRVVYSVTPDTGPAEAWSVPADRSGPAERFIVMPIPIRRTVLSPDSRYAVVTAVDPMTRGDLYLVDIKGDRKPQPLKKSLFNEMRPAVSPDGRWLVYVSDESGHNEVYVRPFPAGGAHVQVSADGGSDPRWEKDSHGIVYRNADRFMKARLAIGANVAVTQRDLLFTGPYDDYDLSPNGTIVALRPGSADAEIIVVTNWFAELKAKLGKK